MSAKHWSRPALLGGSQPQIDAATVMGYRRQAEKLFSGGDPADRKRLLRMWIQEIKLKPVDLEVINTYRLPESVMNCLVAGYCNAPSALLIPYRLELLHSA